MAYEHVSAAVFYHARLAPEGKVYRPAPDEGTLARLGAEGWVDTPEKFGHAADLSDPMPAVLPPADPPPGPGPNPPTVAPPIDIRTMPVDEAVAVVQRVTDRAALERIRVREAGSSKPKGGRKRVLAAVADRLKTLEVH